MNDSLLLASIAEFRELIFKCFAIAGVRTVAEVGAWQGAFTKHLASWAEANQGMIYCVEPHPVAPLPEICESSSNVQLVQGRSPNVLQSFEACDVYILDSDHNYYTVYSDLAALEELSKRSNKEFIIFLQDIGWPFGRRDGYGDPSLIPPEAIHPYTYGKAVIPDSPDLVDVGFSGGDEWAWATEEGGLRNGTMTALEDFLHERTDIVCHIVPCVFHLAVIYPRSLPNASKLTEYLAEYDNNPILARLERNRLAWFVRTLQLEKELEEVQRHAEPVPIRRLARRYLPQGVRKQLRRLIG